MRVKVNSPEGSDAPARPIARGSCAWGARRRGAPPPNGGNPPKGEISGGGGGLNPSGLCPLTGRSASASSNSGSPARSAPDLKFEILNFKFSPSSPAAALREAAVVLFDRLAVTARRRALVAEPQVGAAELLSQALA